MSHLSNSYCMKQASINVYIEMNVLLLNVFYYYYYHPVIPLAMISSS